MDIRYKNPKIDIDLSYIFINNNNNKIRKNDETIIAINFIDTFFLLYKKKSSVLKLKDLNISPKKR